MRHPLESAFAPPKRSTASPRGAPTLTDASGSSNGAANATAGPSYSHRKRPTMERPFVAHHKDFLTILGDKPGMRVIVQDDQGRALYHEAGVWLPETEQVFLTSNRLEDNIQREGKSSLVAGYVDMNLLDFRDNAHTVTTLPPTTHLPSANGACAFGDQVLVCDQGYGEAQPSALSLLDPRTRAVTPLLNNYHGRPFNSLNDVVVLSNPAHPGRPTIWFTDPHYGFMQGFKPEARLPACVYCFDPTSGSVRAVADGFSRPNGIAFDKEGKRCYVTDTGIFTGDGRIDATKPGSIYVFDVEYPPAHADSDVCGPRLVNRSLFAIADSGAPDGIKADTEGNVYAGCGDGVHVWNKHGFLLGKFLFPIPDNEGGGFRGCANFCFIPGGRLACMAEDQIILVEGLQVEGALL